MHSTNTNIGVQGSAALDERALGERTVALEVVGVQLLETREQLRVAFVVGRARFAGCLLPRARRFWGDAAKFNDYSLIKKYLIIKAH